MKFTSLFSRRVKVSSIYQRYKKNMFVIQSEAKNLENINYIYTRVFVTTLLWMTDRNIKKAVVRKPENSRRPDGVLFKSILCLDFFPVFLFKETDSSQQDQHTVTQY